MRTALIVCISLAIGCARPSPSVRLEEGSKKTLDVLSRPKTTSGEIAWSNLESEIDFLSTVSVNQPEHLLVLDRLAYSLALRGRLTGRLEDLHQSVELTSKHIELNSDDGSAYLQRAQRQLSLHRLQEATADLRRAEQRSVNTDIVKAEVAWTLGDLPLARALVKKQLMAGASVQSHLQNAVLELELGHSTEAEEALAQAAALVDDTSPFVAAQLALTAGIIWRRSGQFELAAKAFRLVLQRLPQHVGAMELLAELLGWQGKTDQAVALYEQLVSTSSDPEFKDALASLYESQGESERARELQRLASKDYEERLLLFPEAMYWHGAKHYRSAEKNLGKTLWLLERNAALRPNAKSMAVLAEVQLESGDNVNARANIEAALATNIRSARVLLAAARVFAGLGDLAKSQQFAAEAKDKNPMIEIFPESAD